LEPIDPKTVLDYIKDLKEFLEESKVFERRAFLRSFIESVEVDDSQITLKYTVPLPRTTPGKRRFRF
jgi:site-specific DNA recombinase